MLFCGPRSPIFSLDLNDRLFWEYLNAIAAFFNLKKAIKDIIAALELIAKHQQ